MSECGLRINDILCDNTTYEELHLSSLAMVDDIVCDHLTYDDLNPDMC